MSDQRTMLRLLAADGPDPERSRWTFSDITAGSFTWQGHVSGDGEGTWRRAEEMRAGRRTGPSKANPLGRTR